MKLIVFSGLPATGKSQIADAVGRHSGIPVFGKDWLEATLLRAGLGKMVNPPHKLGYTGYQLLTTLAERQLQLQQSAILDSVVGMEHTRQEWRKLADQYGAAWLVVECICSNPNLHRARVESRRYPIPGWRELSWAQVEYVMAYYEPWREQRLVLDSVQPLADNVQAALGYVAAN